MPLYMDLHVNVPGATAEAVEQAHLSDLEAQEKYGVKYIKYWFNQDAGRIFCLVDAPNSDAAIAVHRDAHGILPDQIIEVGGYDFVDAFLGGMPETPVGGALTPAGTPDGGLRTILFTDMEGSTSVTQRLGDEAAMVPLRAHNLIVREELGRYGGREVKHTGDGIMACFASPSRALTCAVAIQRALAQYNNGHEGDQIAVRMGFAAGEPVEEGDDLFGASVQLAARACAHARPGQILVSNALRELCIGKRFVFIDRGRSRLKGFEQPVRLHELCWDAATLEAQPGST